MLPAGQSVGGAETASAEAAVGSATRHAKSSEGVEVRRITER